MDAATLQPAVRRAVVRDSSAFHRARVRVAIIDDDSGLLLLLERRFAAMRWDHEVLAYPATHDELAAKRLHCLIVDPALTGFDYIERVGRALPGLGLLVCTARTAVADRVRGLRGGADDWITKPCHPEELVARIEAVLRRRRTAELPVGLSRKEYELVYLLAGAEGRVLEREEIYSRVWGYTMVRGDRSVDLFVRKLRQKLEQMSPDWRYVHTHFGVGYRFAAEKTSESA